MDALATALVAVLFILACMCIAAFAFVYLHPLLFACIAIVASAMMVVRRG